MDKPFLLGRLSAEKGDTEMDRILIEIGRLLSLIFGTVFIAISGSDFLIRLVYSRPNPDLWTIIMVITAGLGFMWFFLLLSSRR
jgi:hypothetical protein